MRHLPVLNDGHQLHLIEGGEAYFAALMSAIDEARSHVLLETYIFDFRGRAAEVAQALERAARRGVRVWLVVDGVGTGRLPAAWERRFAEAGVECRIYSPLGTLGLLIPSRWRRLLVLVPAGRGNRARARGGAPRCGIRPAAAALAIA